MTAIYNYYILIYSLPFGSGVSITMGKEFVNRFRKINLMIDITLGTQVDTEFIMPWCPCCGTELDLIVEYCDDCSKIFDS